MAWQGKSPSLCHEREKERESSIFVRPKRVHMRAMDVWMTKIFPPKVQISIKHILSSVASITCCTYKLHIPYNKMAIRHLPHVRQTAVNAQPNCSRVSLNRECDILRGHYWSRQRCQWNAQHDNGNGLRLFDIIRPKQAAVASIHSMADGSVYGEVRKKCVAKWDRIRRLCRRCCQRLASPLYLIHLDRFRWQYTMVSSTAWIGNGDMLAMALTCSLWIARCTWMASLFVCIAHTHTHCAANPNPINTERYTSPLCLSFV